MQDLSARQHFSGMNPVRQQWRENHSTRSTPIACLTLWLGLLNPTHCVAQVPVQAPSNVEQVDQKIQQLLQLEGAAVASEQALPADQVASTKLFWKSGDSLTGELISAASESITWKSPIFVDPLQIDPTALTSIRFPNQAESQPINEPFRISLSNGDVMFGNLIQATDSELLFESSRHGRFNLLRGGIESVKRIDTPDLIYLGPRGIEGWVKPQNSEEESGWSELSNGSITTSIGDRGLFQNLEFPEKCEIEVILESSKVPAFILAFGQHRNSCLRIESWEEVLVVLSRFQFVEVDSMKPESRKVHLILFLDQAENRLSIYSHSGTKLAEIVDKRRFLKPTGIQLWNRGSDLTLSYLRIDRWNGDLPQPLKPGQSRIQTRDGNVVYEKLPPFSDPDSPISIGEGDEQVNVTLEQLNHFVIHDEPPSKAKTAETHLSWKEGGYLSGEIVSITNDRVSFKTSYSTAPIESSLQGIQRISFPNSAQLPEISDELFYEGGSLHGNLVIDNQTDEPIRWTPVGGQNASALSSTGNARFVRGGSADEIALNLETWPDVLYLVNGDVVPCLFEKSTEEIVFVKIPFSDVSEIPAGNVKAIEFSAAGRVSTSDFADENWQRVLGRPVKTTESITFQTSGAYGHESILTGDVVKFRLRWGQQQFSQIIVQLFGSRLGNNKDATNIQINVNGNRLWVEEHIPQQNEVRFFNGVPAGGNRSTVVDLKEGSANVMLAVRDGKVHIIVNDELLRSVSLKDRRVSKKSLTFQTIQNTVTRNTAYGKNPLTDGIIIDQFEVRNHDGASAKQFILQETREKTLLIPRFRRDNPSTHVVLAPNGDVLRGRLVGIDHHEIRIESQLEDFGFPRERVAAVIWLHPRNQQDAAEKLDPAPSESNLEMQLRFGNGFLISMNPKEVVLDQLVGTASSLGLCKIPAPSIREVILGDAPNRAEMTSYSQWIPKFAAEPNWELPDSEGSSPAMELVGTLAKDFELPGLDGTTFRLKEHNGKVVILDFWASWCGPCVAALPDYIEATAGFDPAKVLFVAVNLQESPQVVRQFLRERNLEPQVAMDETGGLASRFRVSGIPHTVILSPNKTIEKVHIGYRQNAGQEMRQTIESILDGTFERTPKVPQAESSPE